MTETEFTNLLSKIDSLFIPKSRGSSGGTWIAEGSIIGGASIKDMEQALKSESIFLDIRNNGESVYIRAEEKDRILLKIPRIPRIHIILFFLTILTTLMAGALMEGINFFVNPLGLVKGIPFSFTLMLILFTHEFGHYYYAQKHGIDATLPYFIPAPTFIGTFGAFIKIKSPIHKKSALLQIGASGPIAGFLIAVPALIIGLILSNVVETSGESIGIILGDSVLMKFLTAIIHPGLTEAQDILLHPVAFAGWIGLLVTMLNLLPIGQLDGGHVAYAILGPKHDIVAKCTFLALIPLSFFSLNWLMWGILILVLMRSTKHPPIYNMDEPLSDKDKLIGYVCLSIFILCFIPAPFQ